MHCDECVASEYRKYFLFLDVFGLLPVLPVECCSKGLTSWSDESEEQEIHDAAALVTACSCCFPAGIGSSWSEKLDEFIQ